MAGTQGYSKHCHYTLLVETGQYHSPTSSQSFRPCYYINYGWLCYIIYMGAFDQVILMDKPNKLYDALQPEIYHCSVAKD